MRGSRKVLEFDGSRSDFTPYGFTCELWTPTRMPKADRHNEIELNFLESGTLTYLLGGQRLMIGARRLVGFWGAVPHQILDWETTKPYYVVTLPLAWFLSCGLPARFVQPILAGELAVDPVATSSDALRLRRWVEDLGSGDPLRARAAELEIQGRLLRLAHVLSGHSATTRDVVRTQAALGRADQLACYIASHYLEPLSSASIAKAVRLHPNYAMTLFRETFGSSMLEFLVRHRVSHAQRLLVTTSDSVVAIANASGFRSLSRFNEAFKRTCGLAPRDYRAAHR